MSIELKNKSNCSGCSACAARCPNKSIKMEIDNEGFLYPVVNKESCNECRLCEKICPTCNKEMNIDENNVINAYAAYSLDENIRENSSSGGIFSALAITILQSGGIVYGVVMNSDCLGARFVRVNDTKELSALRGSKYIQAEVGDAYKTVKKDLKSEKKVLFTGTGCQINGLKAYLGREYDNLYTLDVICHGVPSLNVWRDYKLYLETKMNSNLIEVNFRSKKNGWTNFGMQEFFNGEKTIFIDKNYDPFMHMFLKNYSLRLSCFECTAKKNKLSDLTIGDFWGIEEVDSEFDDGKGVSVVLIRTEKGKKLFSDIMNCVRCKEVLYEQAVKYNSPEYESVHKPPERDVFFDVYNELGFKEILKKYGRDHNTFKSIIKKCIVRVAKILHVERGG